MMPRQLVIAPPLSIKLGMGNPALVPTLVEFVVVRIITWFGANAGTLSELIRLLGKTLILEVTPFDLKYVSWKLFCSVYVMAGDVRVEQFHN